MEELNKKIAEWCGLYLHKGMGRDGSYNEWRDSRGKYVCAFDKPPRLTEKIVLCFEYIVPKLDQLGYVFTLYRFYTIKDDLVTPDEYGFGAKVYKYGVREENLSGIPTETAALALCRAVEKLIDGENASTSKIPTHCKQIGGSESSALGR